MNTFSLSKIFEQAVIKYPEKTACIYCDTSITYSMLNRSANRIANWFIKNNYFSEKIIGIILPRCIQLEAVLLGINKVGNAYMPIGIDYPIDRMKYMLKNAEAEVVIVLNTDEKTKQLEREGLNVITVDELLKEQTEINPHVEINEDALVYVIYTSGSTGRPKGVKVHNKAIMNRIVWMVQHYSFNENDVILQKTPYTFDVSVWELFAWFFCGATLCLLKENMQGDPQFTIKTIGEERISIVHFVPSMLEVFLEVLEEEQIPLLKTLRYMFSSGEALNVRTVKKFNHALYKSNKTKIINLYGPTEAAVDVTYFDDCYLDLDWSSIPIGRPIKNVRTYILDENNCIVENGEVGELCISGIALASGYLNDLSKTKEKFIDLNLEGNEKIRIYKTGDRCRVLPSGDIEYIGRTDNQVKVNGVRIELGEIESCILENNEISEAVVVAETEYNQKVIVAYVVSKLEVAQIMDWLKKRLIRYMLPSHIYKVDKIPKNSHGKTVRNEIKKYYNSLNRGSENKDVRNVLESIWKLVLEVDNVIKDTDDFLQLGGNSMKAMQIQYKVNKSLGIDIRLSKLFVYSKFGDLLNYIKKVVNEENMLDSDMIEIKREEGYEDLKEEKYIPTNFQKRIFLIMKQFPDNIAYNITKCIFINEQLDLHKLKEALTAIIVEQEMLRSVFVNDSSGVYRKIIPIDKFDLNIDYFDFSKDKNKISIEEDKCRFYKFNLEKGPLLFVKVFKIGNQKYQIIVGVHHIIFDGWSAFVFLEELRKKYYGFGEGLNLKDRKTVEKWGKLEHDMFDKEDVKWLSSFMPCRKLKLGIEKMYKKNHENWFDGGYVDARLDAKETVMLREYCKREGITQCVFMMSLFMLLLHYYSRETIITITTTLLNRNIYEEKDIIEPLISTSIVQTIINKEMLLKELFKEISEKYLCAIEHKNVGFEKIVSYVDNERKDDEVSLFQLGFEYIDFLGEDKTKQWKVVELRNNTSKQDICMYVQKENDNFSLVLNFNSSIYNLLDMKIFMNKYIQLVENTIKLEGRNSLQNLKKLTFNEQDEYSEKSEICQNGVIDKYQEKLNLFYTNLIQDQYIKDNQSELSYIEFDRYVNRFANYIFKTVKKKESIIGVWGDLNIDMLVIIMSLIKLGYHFTYLDIYDTSAFEDEMFQKINILITNVDIQCNTSFNFELINICEIKDELPLNSVFYTKPCRMEDTVFSYYNNAGHDIYDYSQMDIIRNIENLHLDISDLNNQFFLDTEIETISFLLNIFVPLFLGSSVMFCNLEDGIEELIQRKYDVLYSTGDNIMKFKSQISNIKVKNIVLGIHDIYRKKLRKLNEVVIKFKCIFVFNYDFPTLICKLECIKTEKSVLKKLCLGRPVKEIELLLYPRDGEDENIGEICLKDKKSEAVIRTGILGRRIKNGVIEYLEEMEKALFIKGKYIPLNDIEYYLEKRDEIVHSKVCVNKNHQLTAYCELKSDIQTGEIKDYLSRYVPVYAIPLVYFQGVFNKNSNSKDLSEFVEIKDSGEIIRSRTEIELQKIWCKYFKDKKINMDSNFFEIGGDSFLIMRIYEEIRELFECNIELINLFNYPTISSLAKHIDKLSVEDSGKIDDIK